jgi:hypothetical protein
LLSKGNLPFNFAVEAAYVGNVGRGILATLNLNAANKLGTALPGNDNAARPLFPRMDERQMSTRGIRTDTNYNSLQLKLDRRFTKGLLVTTNYTYSKAITNSGDDNGGISTPADITIDRGRAGFDRTHSFAEVLSGSSRSRRSWMELRSGSSMVAVDRYRDRVFGTPLDFTTNATNLHARRQHSTSEHQW